MDHPTPQTQPTSAGPQNLACQLCGRACDGSVACRGCGALPFCSDAHLAACCGTGASQSASRHTPEDCARMAAQVARADWLLPSGYPTWARKPPAALCCLLSTLGCHDPPTWRPACPIHGPSALPSNGAAGQAPQFPSDPAIAWREAWAPLSTSDDDSGSSGAPAWRHRGSGGDGESTGADSSTAMSCWRSHAAATGLAPASPAPLLLHHPLTLRHALAYLTPLPPPGDGPLVVHYLGPREELSMLPLFLEVALLLPPGTQLEVALVGPDVPQGWHGAQYHWTELPGGGSLTLLLWHGAYHEALDAWADTGAAGDDNKSRQAHYTPCTSPPHLVFAPNAGLPAFPSWIPTLWRLLGIDSGSGVKVPAFLATDFCEEAVHQSLALLNSLAPGCCTVAGDLNPFRRPHAAVGHATALPACANAMLFGWVDRPSLDRPPPTCSSPPRRLPAG